MGKNNKKIERLTDENLNVSGGTLYVVPDKTGWGELKEGRYKIVGEDVNGNTYNLNNLTRTKLKRELNKLDANEQIEYIDVDEI